MTSEWAEVNPDCSRSLALFNSVQSLALSLLGSTNAIATCTAYDRTITTTNYSSRYPQTVHTTNSPARPLGASCRRSLVLGYNPPRVTLLVEHNNNRTTTPPNNRSARLDISSSASMLRATRTHPTPTRDN